MRTDDTNRSLEQTLGVIRRRAPLIIACCVVVAVVTFAFSKHEVKQYTATASLVFNNNQLSQQVAGLQAVSGGTSQQAQATTNLKLVELGDMAAKTARLLGRKLTKEKVHEDLGVSAQGESNIVNVSATASSPRFAAEIANTYTQEFVKEQENSNHAYYASALALVNRQLAAFSPKQRDGTAGLALQDRAQSLAVLAELRNGNVQIAQVAAVPTSPSSPKTKRNTILGAILGLLLGLALAFLLERLDRRIREPKDLERIYALPLLGVVPESAALSPGKRGGRASVGLPSGEAEAFHLIRAHLRYFNVDRTLRTLVIASAAPGDGKTTVASHLAAAAAGVGSRVLLLEADLRRPTVAQQFGVLSGPGLSDALIGVLSFEEAVQLVELDPVSGEGAPGRTLDVLVAGSALPPNPGELLESHAMAELLERASSTYDLVVVDTPPLTAVSDAFPLLSKVDGVVIVGRVGHNRRDIAERLHETLTGAGAPLLGVIANGLKSRALGSYAYDYGYSNKRPSDGPPAPDNASSNGASSSEERISAPSS